MPLPRYSLFTGDYCCICSRNYGLFIDIFRKFENRQYHIEIEDCLNFKVSRDDGNSSKLCHRCLCNLKLCKELVDHFKASGHAGDLKRCYLCKNRKQELFDILPHAEREKCLIYKLKQCFRYQVPSQNKGASFKFCISCTHKLEILFEMRKLISTRTTKLKREDNSNRNLTFRRDSDFDSDRSTVPFVLNTCEYRTTLLQQYSHSSGQYVKQEVDVKNMKICTVQLVDMKEQGIIKVEKTENKIGIGTRKRKHSKQVVTRKKNLKLQNSQTVFKHDVRRSSRRGKRKSFDGYDVEPVKKSIKVEDTKMHSSKPVDLSPKRTRARKVETVKTGIKRKTRETRKSSNKQNGQYINSDMRIAKLKTESINQKKSIKPAPKHSGKKKKSAPKINKFRFFCCKCKFRTSKKVPMKIHELSHEDKVLMLIIDRCDVTSAKVIAKELLISQNVETPITSQIKVTESSTDNREISDNTLKEATLEKHLETPITSQIKVTESSTDNREIPNNILKEATPEKHLDETSEKDNDNISEEHLEVENTADVQEENCPKDTAIDNKVQGANSQSVCEGQMQENDSASEIEVDNGAVYVTNNSHEIIEESVRDQVINGNSVTEEVDNSEGDDVIVDNASTEEIHEVSDGNTHENIEESEGEQVVNNNAITEPFADTSPVSDISSKYAEQEEESKGEQVVNNNAITEPFADTSPVSDVSSKYAEQEETCPDDTKSEDIKVNSSPIPENNEEITELQTEDDCTDQLASEDNGVIVETDKECTADVRDNESESSPQICSD